MSGISCSLREAAEICGESSGPFSLASHPIAVCPLEWDIPPLIIIAILYAETAVKHCHPPVATG